MAIPASAIMLAGLMLLATVALADDCGAISGNIFAVRSNLTELADRSCATDEAKCDGLTSEECPCNACCEMVGLTCVVAQSRIGTYPAYGCMKFDKAFDMSKKNEIVKGDLSNSSDTDEADFQAKCCVPTTTTTTTVVSETSCRGYARSCCYYKCGELGEDYYFNDALNTVELGSQDEFLEKCCSQRQWRNCSEVGVECLASEGKKTLDTDRRCEACTANDCCTDIPSTCYKRQSQFKSNCGDTHFLDSKKYHNAVKEDGSDYKANCCTAKMTCETAKAAWAAKKAAASGAQHQGAPAAALLAGAMAALLAGIKQ